MTGSRIGISVALMALIMVTCGTVQGAEPPFPMAIGSRWTYDAGPVTVVEEIVGIDDINGEQCLRVTTQVNGKVLSFEHHAVRPDGIYRVTIGGEPVVPPLRFFRFSPRDGEQWEVKSKVGDVDVSGQFKAGKATVTTPTGRYQTKTAQGTGFQSPSGEMNFTYFYAPGIGKVKQVIMVGEKGSQLVLKEFQPAAKP
ncbi:MAG TPA: hypothetical protein VNQ76_04065 [Planctomicrobium sp.]|nr:hypothetical protein [Planctomicrobium sp.]